MAGGEDLPVDAAIDFNLIMSSDRPIFTFLCIVIGRFLLPIFIFFKAVSAPENRRIVHRLRLMKKKIGIALKKIHIGQVK